MPAPAPRRLRMLPSAVAPAGLARLAVLAALVLVAALAAPPLTHADDGAARATGSAPIVLVTTDSDATLAPAAAALERALAEALAATGHAALHGADAAARFEARASSEPRTLSASDLDALPARSESAIKNLALGKYAAARDDLRATLDLADRALEEVSREESRARRVMDACLFMVRTHLETEDPDAARAQAVRCRRMFPDTEPSSQQLHTPEVRELMRAADAEIKNGPHGALIVESRPGGCAVRVNGKRMGVTPLRIEGLAAQGYRVQVECRPERATRGRVYAVTLSGPETRLVVDAEFDDAVHSGERLALHYASDAERDALRLAHAALLARRLGATEAWAIAPDAATGADGTRVRVDRIDVKAREVRASVSLAPPGDAGTPAAAGAPTATSAPVTADVARAAELLLRGESARLVAGAVTRADPWAPPDDGANDAAAADASGDAHTDAALSGWQWAGLGALLAGSGALAAGAFVSLARSDDAEAIEKLAPTSPGYLDAAAEWRDGRTLPLVLGPAGGALATVGVALLLEPEDGVPWYAWATGALGLGVGALGAVLLATEGPCDGRADGRYTGACLQGETDFVAAALLTSVAAPLVAIPITFALKPDAGRGERPVQVGATATPHGGLTLTVGGAL